ncbi:hypothetical protein KR059_006527, partial [Drosophila kikkawai]
ITFFFTDGFFQIGTKNYFIRPIKTNFFAARDLCIQNNGDLATFGSKANLDDVLDYLVKNKEELNGDIHFWTSYFDLGRAKGMFYSIATGRPLNVFGWLPNEPNSSGNDEHCVNIWTKNEKYGLNDANCMLAFRVLCEETKPQWMQQPI